MTPGRGRLTGTLYVLAAITSWGAYFPFAKIILTKLTPAAFLVFRFGFGVIILFALSRRVRAPRLPARADLPLIFLAAFVGIVVHQLIQLAGLSRTTATNTGWILTLIPPITGVAGWAVLGEKLSARKIAGLLVAMAGVVVLVSRGHLNTLSFGRHIGDLLALASVFTWSTYTILMKSRLHRYNALQTTTVQMAFAVAIFAAIGLRDVVRLAGTLSASDWLIVTLIGAIPSGFAYYWWNTGLQRLTAFNTSVFLFIEAIVASVTGLIVLGESFTIPMAMATVVIVAGVYWTQSARE